MPTAGCGKPNVYVASEPVTDVAGMPLTNRSAASTPETVSLNVTVMFVSSESEAPAGGDWAMTNGLAKSRIEYVQVALADMVSNGSGGLAMSKMAAFGSHEMVTVLPEGA